MASITIRVDEETKKEASRIVEDFGFDLSSVTRAFYRQIVRENRIPPESLVRGAKSGFTRVDSRGRRDNRQRRTRLQVGRGDV